MRTEDSDSRMRIAAFEHVRRLSDRHDHLTQKELSPGFIFEGERIPLVNLRRGIFKPRKMRYLLSIKTVFPRPNKRIWYDDQKEVHRQIYQNEEAIEYAFMGQDPKAAENLWLRGAFENQIPVIYFLGVAPKCYMAVFPAYISGWDAAALKARVTFGVLDQVRSVAPQDTTERRYALRKVSQRLHQSSFREAVITAYRGRCALSGFPEKWLLDAAHIISDRNEQMGQPIVQNGLPLSKIHHAAFDRHLIGIDPDFRLHVSERLLDQRDGAILEALKQLDGGMLHLPPRARDYPDRDRLALRFEQFQAVA